MAVRVKAQVLLNCPDLFSFWGGELGLVVVFPASGALSKQDEGAGVVLGPNVIPRVSVSLSSHPTIPWKWDLEQALSISGLIRGLVGILMALRPGRYSAGRKLVALTVAPDGSTPSPTLPPC